MRRTWPTSTLLLTTLLSGTALGQTSAPREVKPAARDGAEVSGADPLRDGFVAPPESARPRVWWHWMNGNVTKDGIRKDIEWMKRIGIGGMQTFDADLGTPQVVEKRLAYMTPEWKDAFRYAAELADRNDMELAIAASPGWSETGGPWVPAADGLKKLVWAETSVRAGDRGPIRLASPPNVTGPFQDIAKAEPMGGAKPGAAPDETLYRDVSVLAFPATAANMVVPATLTDGSGAAVPAAALADGRYAEAVEVRGTAADTAPVIAIRYAQPQPVQGITLFVPGGKVQFRGATVAPRLEASDDGRTWRKLADIPVGDAPSSVSFPPTTARDFRVVFAPAQPSGGMAGLAEPAPGADPGFFGAMTSAPRGPASVKVAELRLWTGQRVDQYERKAAFDLAPDYYALSVDLPEAKGIDPASVIDLTDRLRPDGTLDWAAPEGDWTVLRLGYSLLGTTNHPAPPEATGLEVDKFDAAAVRRYLEHYLGMYRETTGPDLIGRRGVRALLTDSIEVGAANWTPRLVERFKKLRGYDPSPYLPALTGVVIGLRSASDRFLYDFRRTLSDLMASEHYGTVAAVAHENGLKVYGEALEDKRPSLGDDMAMRSYADVPMAAMWTYARQTGPRPTLVADIKGAASVANIYGQNLVAAESLTSMLSPWNHAPSDLRPVIDLEFVQGVNRPIIHTSVHQPVDDKLPGLSLMIFGQYFNRHDSWAEMAKPWVDYIARSSYLLQQGRNVADVLYFYGEEAPLTGLFGEKLVADAPVRYAYDFANTDVLATKLTVENGDLVAPSGARYRVLYLGGSSAKMTVPTLRRLTELATAGATIVGNAPVGSPSLADDAGEFRTLVARLWSGAPETRVGAGRVVASKDIEAALQSASVAPDFAYAKSAADSDVLFSHRRTDDADIYFLSNRSVRPERFDAQFRVAGRAPEIWRADTAEAQPISYRTENGSTSVTLEMAPQESYFVVFRGKGQASATVRPVVGPKKTLSVGGPWQVSFASPVGSPPGRSMSALTPLQLSDDADVRYFSGTTTYSTTIDLSAADGRARRAMLDLGRVGDIAEVRVNGRLVGTAWHAPFALDIAPALKAGRNRVEIKVANLWVNRLIGDAQPGAKKVTFTTMPTYKPDAPLRPSGLIGPVTLTMQAK